MTIKQCADAIAHQSLLVDTLGMGNVAHLSAADRLARIAEYEIEKTRLDLLREQLLTLMREQVSYEATQEAANIEYREIARLLNIH
jgi:hypothetical protein